MERPDAAQRPNDHFRPISGQSVRFRQVLLVPIRLRPIVVVSARENTRDALPVL
jgi:hypothetical protein